MRNSKIDGRRFYTFLCRFLAQLYERRIADGVHKVEKVENFYET